MPRSKGAKVLSKVDKAQIIAQKNAALCPRSEIAENFGVSVSTVTHLSLTVPDDVAELATAFETALIRYAKANALKAARRTFDAIDDLPADKAAIVQEKNYNMVRLHQNQPTGITKQQQDPVQLYVAKVRRVVDRTDASVEQAVEVGVSGGYIPEEYKEAVLRALIGGGE